MIEQIYFKTKFESLATLALMPWRPNALKSYCASLYYAYLVQVCQLYECSSKTIIELALVELHHDRLDGIVVLRTVLVNHTSLLPGTGLPAEWMYKQHEHGTPSWPSGRRRWGPQGRAAPRGSPTPWPLPADQLAARRRLSLAVPRTLLLLLWRGVSPLRAEGCLWTGNDNRMVCDIEVLRDIVV